MIRNVKIHIRKNLTKFTFKESDNFELDEKKPLGMKEEC
jgi:hypothetical protein